MAKAVDPKPPQSFEAAVSELETLITSMEGGQLSLEGSLAAYKRGAELLKFCQAALADAQQQIKVFEGDLLKDWEGDGDSE